VKQILRQADGGFDERRYNFGGLMDLLKALQREQFVRVERDRRGGLRVFQGSNLPKMAQMPTLEGLPQVDESYEAIEELVGNVAEEPAAAAASGLPQPDVETEGEPVPQLVDTTAELLGRATPKPRRPRATRAAAPKAAKPKKTAAKPSTRSSKATSHDARDESEA
jgi:hypothetical protein